MISVSNTDAQLVMWVSSTSAENELATINKGLWRGWIFRWWSCQSDSCLLVFLQPANLGMIKDGWIFPSDFVGAGVFLGQKAKSDFLRMCPLSRATVRSVQLDCPFFRFIVFLSQLTPLQKWVHWQDSQSVVCRHIIAFSHPMGKCWGTQLQVVLFWSFPCIFGWLGWLFLFKPTEQVTRFFHKVIGEFLRFRRTFNGNHSIDGCFVNLKTRTVLLVAAFGVRFGSSRDKASSLVFTVWTIF